MHNKRKNSLNLQPLIPANQFVGLQGITHLCTGGEAPWLKSQKSVYDDFTRLKSTGYEGRNEIYARGERCRRRLAKLWHVPAQRIAFMPSAAEGMNWLARGLDWREGDNVVTTNLEFPSVAYAWKHLRGRGVEVRLVPHRNWLVHESDLLAAVDSRTRVLAVSHVSFYTGQCLDLEQLAKGIAGLETLFAVDATHSSGVIDVPVYLTDMTVSSSYKWMLAAHGIAPCYLSKRAEERTETTCFGWHNLAVWPAQGAERHDDVPEKPMPNRLEPGNPAMLMVMHLDHALEILLSIGLERITNHARSLANQVGATLEALGLSVISPSTFESRSGNTCFLYKDSEGMNHSLAMENVLCWGGYDRVRISTHLYNSSEDIAHCLDVLSTLLSKG